MLVASMICLFKEDKLMTDADPQIPARLLTGTSFFKAGYKFFTRWMMITTMVKVGLGALLEEGCISSCQLIPLWLMMSGQKQLHGTSWK